MSDKILVRGVNWVGDAVMTIPALKGLRKAYPESKLSLLVKPSVASIFEKDPAIDEIILYDERFKGIIGRLRLAIKLRRIGFSKAILFQNAFDAALISFLAGIPERIGYDRDRRGFLLTKPIPSNNYDRKIHHIHYYINLLRESGIKADYVQPFINLSLEERLTARDSLSVLKRPLLGINPGATYGSAKRWFPDRFAEVAQWFMKDTRGSVVIFGGRNESDIAEEIEKTVIRQSGAGSRHFEFRSFELLSPNSKMNSSPVAGHSLLNMAGKTSLRELISLISECDVFLTNDSGPMHIAYAVGTPQVALFGSSDPNLTGIVGEGNTIIKNDFDCSPCFERTCKNSDMRCMYAITSDEVFLAIRRLLPDKPAVFFDRDGTLCEDVDYLNNWDDFNILPGVDDLLKLKTRGFKIIGATNQSGIARGLINEDFVKKINEIFIEKFGFDDFYYCPHHPDEHCSCRKPEPGMLLNARYKYGIDLRKSYVVGDKDADMILAKAVGAKGILVQTGMQKESSHADFIAEGLKEAMDFIMKNGGA